jgi:hypothetical protein
VSESAAVMRPQALHMTCVAGLPALYYFGPLIQCVSLVGSPRKCWFTKRTKYSTFACHTCVEMRLCVLGIRKKEVGNTKR